MADGYERYTADSGGNGAFLVGLLTGAAIGAGLGLLFAPKPGAELRSQLSEQAGNLANTAAEGYRRASQVASKLADRGRDLYDEAGRVVSRTASDAGRVVSRTASDARDMIDEAQRIG